MIVLRAVKGKAWEDMAAVFRQIGHIGPRSIGKLESNGITSECYTFRKDSCCSAFDKLHQTPAVDIERLLGRASNDPDSFGRSIHKMIQTYPRYRVILA